MKRNEKIEVRVSAEEKEALTELAAAEGATASDVVRDRLFAQEARAVPVLMSGGIGVALGAAIALGAVWVAPFLQAEGPTATTAELSFQYVPANGDGPVRPYSLQSNFKLTSVPQDIVLPVEDGDILITPTVVPQGEENLYFITLSVCQSPHEEAACQPLGEPKLLVQPRSPARVEYTLDGGEFIDLRVMLR